MNGMKNILLYFVFLLTPIIYHAQDSASVEKFRFKPYLKSYWTDARDIAVKPFLWEPGEWYTAAGGIVIDGVLLCYDKEIQEFVQNSRTKTSGDITKYGLEPWGHYYTIGTLGLLYFQGALFKNKHHKSAALTGLKAYILSACFVRIPKFVFARKRPFETSPLDAHQWEWFDPDYSSFFSGHTITVFSVATVLAYEYKDIKAVPWIAWSIAGLSGLSRINDNKHWASDVFTGALAGYGIGKLIYSNKQYLQVGLTPSVGGTSVCVKMQF